MSSKAIGRGLLAGFRGALGGAEEFFKEEREFDRTMSLEEFRQAKQKELIRFREQLGRETSALNFGREQGATIAAEARAEDRAKAAEERRHGFTMEEIEARAAAYGSRGGALPSGAANNALDVVSSYVQAAFGDILAEASPDLNVMTDGFGSIDDVLTALLSVDDPRARQVAEEIVAFKSAATNKTTPEDSSAFVKRIQSILFGGEAPEEVGAGTPQAGDAASRRAELAAKYGLK